MSTNETTKGFSLSAIATRVQTIDGAFTWKRYTALATLARLSGATKKIVEAKIFGTEKPSKDFNNAWSRAGNVYSVLFSGDKDKCASIRCMGIDDAEKAMVAAIDGHMAALEVNGKNAYDAVIEYACKADIPAAEVEPEAAPEPAPAPEASPAADNVVSLVEAAAGPSAFDVAVEAINVLAFDDQLSIVEAFIEAADADTLNHLAGVITARMLAAQSQALAA